MRLAFTFSMSYSSIYLILTLNVFGFLPVTIDQMFWPDLRPKTHHDRIVCCVRRLENVWHETNRCPEPVFRLALELRQLPVRPLGKNKLMMLTSTFCSEKEK